jgi:methionine-rich copper-binding protein CopC/putative copper export protein
MRRRTLIAIVSVVLAAAAVVPTCWAHAVLLASDPARDAVLIASPTEVRLTFSEPPEAAFSTVVVADAAGTRYESGRPSIDVDDSSSLVVPVRRLPRGVYTVRWRVVSSLDGHSTAGAFSFGVQAEPAPGILDSARTRLADSAYEAVARWVFLLGLVVLLGAATAATARFGAGLLPGAIGLGTAAAGLLLLADAQRRNARTSFGELLKTPLGHALGWRALGLAIAGTALLVAHYAPARTRRAAMAAAGLGAIVSVWAHVAHGHAAAGRWPASVSIALQCVHVTATGMWLGGLFALLLAVRGKPSLAKADATRRFSTLAAAGICVVAVTGIARSVDELSSWSELASARYGRAIAAKVFLLAAIALLGLHNRRRDVPLAANDLGPLRRVASVELMLAASALAVAAVLGTLAPPATARLQARGLSVSGVSRDATIRVRLETASAAAGPNIFTVQVDDYDTGRPVRDANVRIGFRSLEYALRAEPPMTLSETHPGSYVGSGDGLAFAGRWRATVLVRRGADRVAVPLNVATTNPAETVSIERIPGRPPTYTVESPPFGYVRISPDPNRAGPSTIRVIVYDYLGDDLTVDRVAVWDGPGDTFGRQLETRRTGRGRFTVPVDLASGRNAISVAARTSTGTRLRGAFELDVPPH